MIVMLEETVVTVSIQAGRVVEHPLERSSRAGLPGVHLLDGGERDV